MHYAFQSYWEFIRWDSIVGICWPGCTFTKLVFAGFLFEKKATIDVTLQ